MQESEVAHTETGDDSDVYTPEITTGNAYTDIVKPDRKRELDGEVSFADISTDVGKHEVPIASNSEDRGQTTALEGNTSDLDSSSSEEIVYML